MSSIHIEQNGVTRTLSVPADETLLSALRRAGYSIPAACGGKGRCGKCRVPVNGVPRLACRVYPADGDTVTLPETAGANDGISDQVVVLIEAEFTRPYEGAPNTRQPAEPVN